MARILYIASSINLLPCAGNSNSWDRAAQLGFLQSSALIRSGGTGTQMAPRTAAALLLQGYEWDGTGMAKLQKNLRRTMRLVASDGCEICQSTGVRAANEYERVSRKLVVTFDICPCVRVRPVNLMLPKVTPDVVVVAPSAE